MGASEPKVGSIPNMLVLAPTIYLRGKGGSWVTETCVQGHSGLWRSLNLGQSLVLAFVTLSWVQLLLTLRALKIGKSYQPQRTDDLKGPKTAPVAIQKTENRVHRRLCPCLRQVGLWQA